MDTPKRGRPRKAVADEATQKKRDYQRTYQEERKNKITELTRKIKECEDDLKKMKKERTELKKMAREKLSEFRNKNNQGERAKQEKKSNKIPMIMPKAQSMRTGLKSLASADAPPKSMITRPAAAMRARMS